jgi:hypothetical protein
VYVPSSSRCGEGIECSVTLGGERRRVRSIGAYPVQWLEDSVVFVAGGQSVVRLWPDRDKRETLFTLAPIRR